MALLVCLLDKCLQGDPRQADILVLIDRAYDLPELPNMMDRQRETLDILDNIAEDPSLHF